MLLTTLPNDILYLIVQYLIRPRRETTRVKYKELRSLRLVCRLFADLHAINRLLFKSIKLTASVEDLAALENANFERFFPYVKRIAFAHPPQTWFLMSVFEEVVAARLGTIEMRLRGIGLEEFEPEKNQFIIDLLHGLDPLNRRQLQEAYKCHIRQAVKQQALLDSDIASERWAKLLIENLPTVTSFRILSPSGGFCRGDALVGDAVFSAVFRTLELAKRQPTRLKIEGLVSTDCLNPDDKSWQSLDLSNLSKFSFGPDVHKRTRPLDRPIINTVAANRFVSWAVYSSHHKLLKLSLSSRIIWPGPDPIPLTNLQSLEYRGAQFHGYKFAAWLPQLTSLKTLTLQGRCTEDRISWKEIYNALRIHPNRLHVRFMSVYISFWMNDVDLEVDTNSDCADLLARYTGVYTDSYKQDALDDFLDSSYLYLCDKIEWNESLEVGIFGFGDGDASESDEDEDSWGDEEDEESWGNEEDEESCRDEEDEEPW